MKTAEAVTKAVIKGFEPFKAELIRPISEDDVDHLLKIPIRRISLYDINKNRAEVLEINKRLKEIAKLLKNLVAYAIDWLDGFLAKALESLGKDQLKRKTKIKSFNAVDVKEIVKRDTPLRYDAKTGYLGTSVTTGTELFKVTPYDRILVMRHSGVYTVCDVPEKLFVDKNMWYCGLADKDELGKVLFTVIFKDLKTKYMMIKRCRITQFILNRDYSIVPEDSEVCRIDTRNAFSFYVKFTPKPRLKQTEQLFHAGDYEEKGAKTQGVRLASKEADKIMLEKKKIQTELL